MSKNIVVKEYLSIALSSYTTINQLFKKITRKKLAVKRYNEKRIKKLVLENQSLKETIKELKKRENTFLKSSPLIIK